MEQKILRQVHHIAKNILFFAPFFLCLEAISSVEAYKNYTVGDSLGWYDKLGKPDVDYEKWVSTKSFSLGDFLSKFLFFPLFFPCFSSVFNTFLFIEFKWILYSDYEIS